MKLSERKFMSMIGKLEELMDVNFDAKGESFAAKATSIGKETPKGVAEKLAYLANLYDRAQRGEKPTAAELKQAGYWINAVWPYLSNGVPMPKGGASRLVALIAIVALAALAWYFLRG